MSTFKGQGDPTEIKRNLEAKRLCTPEHSSRESVKVAESMATRWQIVHIERKGWQWKDQWKQNSGI
jgi:hypothetical protein